MGRRSECSGLCPERDRPPQQCGNGYTAIASHGHCLAVWLAMVAVVRLDNGRFPLRWRGGACLMAGVCPNQILSGHTAIVSHDHCSRGSVANYGGRCPVGQRLVSTRVEGRYLPHGWYLPRPRKFSGPHGGAGTLTYREYVYKSV